MARERAESSREAARRAAEKKAMADASKKEEEAMEKYAASVPASDANPKVLVRETKPPPPTGGDGRTDFEKYGRKIQPECADRNSAEECTAWAAEGECAKNPGFMRAHCRRSCNLCGSADGSEGKAATFIEEVQSPAKAAAAAAAAAPCEDKSDSCKAWTKAGECERNREFMHAECRRSCNLCVEPTNLFRNPNPKPPATKPVPEEQKPTTEQEAKQRRHLEAPGTSTPPKQLGTGSPAAKATVKCADSNARCPDWAKAGECPRNAAFMRANCPLSCDLCGESRFQKLATMP